MSNITPNFHSKSNFDDFIVDAYLLNALNNSKSDREFILRIEAQLVHGLLRNSSVESQVEFTELNSYYRMLVHRVARYYDLQRTADSILRTVSVWRPPSSHPKPLLKLSELVEPDSSIPPEETINSTLTTKKFIIMKRTTSCGTHPCKVKATIPTKTFEEREKEYEAARARIFEDFKETEIKDSEPVITPLQTIKPKVRTLSPLVIDQDEVVEFQGWRDVDSIKPFVPSLSINILPKDSKPLEVFDFESIWIPQHVFVVNGLPKDDLLLKSLKSKCKTRHAKLYCEKNSSSGLLVFSYKVSTTEEDHLSTNLGLVCTRWKPQYFTEPPL